MPKGESVNHDAGKAAAKAEALPDQDDWLEDVKLDDSEQPTQEMPANQELKKFTAEAHKKVLEDLKAADLENDIEKTRSSSVEAIAKSAGISQRAENKPKDKLDIEVSGPHDIDRVNPADLEVSDRVKDALAKVQEEHPDVDVTAMARDADKAKALSGERAAALPPTQEAKVNPKAAAEAKSQADIKANRELEEAKTAIKTEKQVAQKRAEIVAAVDTLRAKEAAKTRTTQEQHAIAQGVYDVKSARIRPAKKESGWSRFKKGLSGLFERKSPKLEKTTVTPKATKETKPAPWETGEKPVATTATESKDETIAAAQKMRAFRSGESISARKATAEKRGFFSRLFGRKEKANPGAKYREALEKHDRVPTYTKKTTQEDLKKFQGTTAEAIKKQAKERKARGEVKYDKAS